MERGISILEKKKILFFPFHLLGEPITCKFLEIIIYIGVYWAFPHMNYLSSESNEVKQNLV